MAAATESIHRNQTNRGDRKLKPPHSNTAIRGLTDESRELDLRDSRRTEPLDHAAACAAAGLLMALAAALLGWGTRHTETSFADGCATSIWPNASNPALAAGALQATDHPLHPLLIAAMHRLLGGDGPNSWQASRAYGCRSVARFCSSSRRTCSPSSYLARRAAWLACLLVTTNPLSNYIVVNVLSESTFLLPWTFGLWAAIRFLQAGRIGWLVLAIGFGAVAYLTRPEGLLLSLALLATLITSAIFRATRLDSRRCWRLIAFVVSCMLLLAGPFVALRGGLGTKPGIARVLGLAPRSNPLRARAREAATSRPTFSSDLQDRVGPHAQGPAPAVTPALTIRFSRDCRTGATKILRRGALFLGMVLAASAVALVRLHATGGYCTTAPWAGAGHAVDHRGRRGSRLLDEQAHHPRPMGRHRRDPRGVSLAGVVAADRHSILSSARGMDFQDSDPFAVYHHGRTGSPGTPATADKMLDMTDWSLYLSRRPGYHFADVYKAAADRATRWIVVREPHVEGRWPYTKASAT